MDKQVADRIHGTILASACANSLGGSCIGLNRRDIVAAIGLNGISDFTGGLKRSYLPDHKPGSWLADTFLAVELGESLVADKGYLNLEDLKQRYTQLLENKQFLMSAPGAPCLAGLRRTADGLEPQADGSPESLEDSGAIRAFPLGLLPEKFAIGDQAIKQARLTQGDSRVWAAAAVLADSIFWLVQGNKLVTPTDVKTYITREFDIAGKIDGRLAESWDDVAPDLDYANPANELPYSLLNVESYINELIPTAVGIFLIFRHDLEQAIIQAACAGGATDSVSAIVGALVGAYHGASAIPQRWLDKLEDRKRLESLAENIISLW